MPDTTMAGPAITGSAKGSLPRGSISYRADDNRIRQRVWAQPVIYLGLAMLVAIYGVLTFLIVGDRREAEALAMRQGDNLVRIIDQSYSNRFQSIDSSLLFLRKVYRQNPAAFDMAEWVRDASIRTDLTYNYVIADNTGKIVSAMRALSTKTSEKVVGLNIANRAYFRDQVEANSDALYISAPITLRVSGDLAMVLSRRISDVNGRFLGIVTALIDPVQFGRDATAIDLGPNGTFGLLGLDGIVRTRVIGGKIDMNVTGRKVPPGYGVLGRVAGARSGHYWNTPGLLDGVSRLVSYRLLGSYPMVAAVTMTENDVFRRVREAERTYLIIALLLTVGILFAVRRGVMRERMLVATTAALTQSQERYTMVEAALNDGIWDWDILSDAYYRSPRWKGIVGFGDDELANNGHGFRDLLHADDRRRVGDALHAHLEHGKPYDLEFRLRHKDGEYRWVHSRGKASRAADGRAIRMLGSMTDITERKAVARTIEEDRANLARAEEMVRLGHYKYDVKSATLIWSQGTYRIFGKSPETFTPTFDTVRELFDPEDRPLFDKARVDVLEGRESPPVALRAINDDGQVVYIQNWSMPTFAADGMVSGYFGTAQDITALRRNEALLSESNANLERAERLALLGHYKIERSSGELIWSDGVYRIFGLSPETFTPTLRNALELIHPDDRVLLKQFRDEAMAGREVPHATLRAFRADGSEVEFEYWSTPVRANGGSEVTGIFGTVQDITLRKRVETALARANLELEERVFARTTELAEEMQRREQAQTTLAQMQKMEVVGQLTAGIAHDFNNLLAVIGGSLEFVDVAAAQGLTADPELVDAAMRATRRGRELVRRLLAFARQSPLRAEATAIDQLVLDTLRLLRRTLGQGIEMVTHLDAKAAVISVDRNQMANALLNLALNARDAMPEGGKLTIATRVQKADAGDGTKGPSTGEEVVITISDTGVGMTEEVRSRAFEPFFTTKPDGLGSGLGLSMVQGFVEQSGGHIEIKSEAGGGTTFVIKLPRIALASRDDEADAVSGLSVQGREKTVLLVEDDPDVRIVTAAQIKRLGYKVHAVNDGMEAIDLIASPATIDITLTDIVLPGGLDGVELIKEAMRARPKMGVLCMSGYDPTQKHRKWLQIQNINFLEKPFSSSRLAQALNDALVE